MIKINPTIPYQERVNEIYTLLEDNAWCSLCVFELYVRRINILNSKIKNLSADLGNVISRDI